MKSTPESTLSEHIACSEIKVKCPGCQVAIIAKKADLRSNKLLRCPACRTPINVMPYWGEQETGNY